MIAIASAGRFDRFYSVHRKGGNMGPSRSNHRKNIRLNVPLGIAMLLGASAVAQDVKLNVTYAVSYTHLDVYKRQLQGQIQDSRF